MYIANKSIYEKQMLTLTLWLYIAGSPETMASLLGGFNSVNVGIDQQTPTSPQQGLVLPQAAVEVTLPVSADQLSPNPWAEKSGLRCTEYISSISIPYYYL
jgi:hypothetical protein